MFENWFRYKVSSMVNIIRRVTYFFSDMSNISNLGLCMNKLYGQTVDGQLFLTWLNNNLWNEIINDKNNNKTDLLFRFARLAGDQTIADKLKH